MKESKIPDFTEEFQDRIESNTQTLLDMGVKDWMRKRKKKANMDDVEQEEAVRKIEENLYG